LCTISKYLIEQQLEEEEKCKSGFISRNASLRNKIKCLQIHSLPTTTAKSMVAQTRGLDGGNVSRGAFLSNFI